MPRLPRFALLALLVLLQCFAPWVHAHTGLETGGFLHLPGWEFLDHGDHTDMVPPADDDVIVALSASLPEQGGHGLFGKAGADRSPWLAARAELPAAPRARALPAPGKQSASIHPLRFPACPRAPPTARL